ncbi:MAG: EamA family transporter [Clostridiales Family XIII bacterium]|jgi:drug/metabolite transporter (DMT)-like permease|nr:EamA family transporter [Clostridiales Family XIII bacterium]
MWVLFLIAHLVGNTGYNTLLRHASAKMKVDSIFLATVMSTAIAAPAAVGFAIRGIDVSRFDARLWWLFALSCAIAVVFHICNAKALECTEASVFALLYNLRIVGATAFGILFLSEPVAPLRMAGGGLVFLAGFLLLGRAGTTPRGAALTVLSAVLISSLNTLEKHLIQELGYANYVFPSALIVAAALWGIVLISRRPVDLSLFRTREITGLFALRIISAYGFTLALGLGGLLSISTYVSSLTCITTAAAGILFLKERDALGRKLAAAAIALAGVTILSLAA